MLVFEMDNSLEKHKNSHKNVVGKYITLSIDEFPIFAVIIEYLIGFNFVLDYINFYSFLLILWKEIQMSHNIVATRNVLLSR